MSSGNSTPQCIDFVLRQLAAPATNEKRPTGAEVLQWWRFLYQRGDACGLRSFLRRKSLGWVLFFVPPGDNFGPRSVIWGARTADENPSPGGFLSRGVLSCVV